MGQKGWTPHHGHPASCCGRHGVGCCGYLPWACTRSTTVFLAKEAPGGRATLRNEETHPAQLPPLILHPSSILPLYPPFPSAAPPPPPAVPIRHRQLPVPPPDQCLSVCLQIPPRHVAPHHRASATAPAPNWKAARALCGLRELVWVWAGGPAGHRGPPQALLSP